MRNWDVCPQNSYPAKKTPKKKTFFESFQRSKSFLVKFFSVSSLQGLNIKKASKDLHEIYTKAS